jgi:hypothetical protein
VPDHGDELSGSAGLRARGGERDERRDRVRRGRHDEDLERQDEPESDEEVGEAVLLALGRLVDALLDDVDARVRARWSCGFVFPSERTIPSRGPSPDLRYVKQRISG